MTGVFKNGRLYDRLGEKPVKEVTISPARKDGRPQYYDIAAGSRAYCYQCLLNDNHARYTRGEAVVNDPANSPTHDGSIYTICVAHIPENAVIHDPVANVTRTKDGSSTWTEKDG